ncbi:MAG: hypothetical protein A2X11_10800 [Bacteroidetes bacterium GWE2_42_24]|nr:MAG: hypothetical protein A2X11_10800 [Bacteroidetes bacterium GWE2_42_24]OFY27110.1 MAG: hypothetical protein A2X09_17310 [Bacteroidetes bacterium GWF2_43_11]HCU20660.1 superoxide dismutase [Bacteroidales bacterium]
MKTANKSVLRALPRSYDAREPIIDQLMLEINYGKHHINCCEDFITAIKGTEIESMVIQDIIRNLSKFLMAFRNSDRVFLYHASYRGGIKDFGDGLPTGNMSDVQTESFTSFDEVEKQFSNACKTLSGRSKAWLCLDDKGYLYIGSTPDQDIPQIDIDTEKGILLTEIDAMERAYYQKYLNKRPVYIDTFRNVVNRSEVAKRYEEALN